MHLDTEGETVLSKFLDLGLGYGTIYRALGALEIMKLTTERSSGNRRLISLSEKGKVVAKRLKELDDYCQYS